MKKLILNNSQKLTSKLFLNLSKQCHDFEIHKFNILLNKYSPVLITENIKTFESFIYSDVCFLDDEKVKCMDLATYTNLIENDEYISFELKIHSENKESFILRAVKY